MRSLGLCASAGLAVVLPLALSCGRLNFEPEDAGTNDGAPADVSGTDAAGELDVGQTLDALGRDGSLPMDVAPMDVAPSDAGGLDASALDRGALDGGADSMPRAPLL